MRSLRAGAYRPGGHGLLALDPKLDLIKDRFLSKSLMMAIDAVPLDRLRETMETELDLQEERDELIVRVLESAGGFAPTLGIVGAVLGLIQVMQRMDDVGEHREGNCRCFCFDAVWNRLRQPWSFFRLPEGFAFGCGNGS